MAAWRRHPMAKQGKAATHDDAGKMLALCDSILREVATVRTVAALLESMDGDRTDLHDTLQAAGQTLAWCAIRLEDAAS